MALSSDWGKVDAVAQHLWPEKDPLKEKVFKTIAKVRAEVQKAPPNEKQLQLLKRMKVGSAAVQYDVEGNSSHLWLQKVHKGGHLLGYVVCVLHQGATVVVSACASNHKCLHVLHWHRDKGWTDMIGCEHFRYSFFFSAATLRRSGPYRPAFLTKEDYMDHETI